MRHEVTRYHDISCGHRVVGHESKCRHFHGHNYRIHFTCEAEQLDQVGRVIDFSVIKEKLCMWVENNWDHKFLHWIEDPVINHIRELVSEASGFSGVCDESVEFNSSMVGVTFNPTAENMAEYLVKYVGPAQLKGTGVRLVKVLIEETAKCHASFQL